jgi:hypothetical protein
MQNPDMSTPGARYKHNHRTEEYRKNARLDGPTVEFQDGFIDMEIPLG